MSEMATSVKGVPIRLPDERWAHIVRRHPELTDRREQVLATVAEPLRILAGRDQEQLAVREVEPGKMMVVAYREAAEGGFVVTAFLTRRIKSLERRKQLWP
jgi:hypothetical protein